MQNNKTEKIIIDKVKLITLQRLGCSEKAIIDKIIYGKFCSQNDELIDLLLSSLTDEKTFSNWGGSRENSGRKHQKNNNLNQDENQLEKIKLIKSSCINQLVDKDKDKDKEIDRDKIKNNRYGECKNVLLTEEQYNKLLSENDNFDLAIEKLDTWLGTSGSKYKNKNHYAYFKSNSWVWSDLRKKELMF